VDWLDIQNEPSSNQLTDLTIVPYPSESPSEPPTEPPAEVPIYPPTNPPTSSPISPPVHPPVNPPVSPPAATSPVAAPVGAPSPTCQPRGNRPPRNYRCPKFLFGDYCNCWIIPILECVEMAGQRDFIAHFGFQVKCIGPMPSVIEVDIGDNNCFQEPAPKDAGQPWTFCVPPNGRVYNAFSRRWDGRYHLIWKLGKYLTSTSSNKRCPASPSSTTSPSIARRNIFGEEDDGNSGFGWDDFGNTYTFMKLAGTITHAVSTQWFP